MKTWPYSAPVSHREAGLALTQIMITAGVIDRVTTHGKGGAPFEISGQLPGGQLIRAFVYLDPPSDDDPDVDPSADDAT